MRKGNHQIVWPQMMVTFDEQFLLTASQDGCLMMWKLVDKDGRGLKTTRQIVHAEEMLVTKADLEETVRTGLACCGPHTLATDSGGQSNANFICDAEPEHDGNEAAAGGAAHGARVPAPSEGHELQREDKGALRQVNTTNGHNGNNKAGLLLRYQTDEEHHLHHYLLTHSR